MPLQAKAEPNSEIVYGDAVFQFGDDGTRQISRKERELLERYRLNGGPMKIDITEVEPETPYDEQTVDALRKELKKRGLSTSGRKDTLVRRVQADDAGDDATAITDDDSDANETEG